MEPKEDVLAITRLTIDEKPECEVQAYGELLLEGLFVAMLRAGMQLLAILVCAEDAEDQPNRRHWPWRVIDGAHRFSAA